MDRERKEGGRKKVVRGEWREVGIQVKGIEKTQVKCCSTCKQ